MANDAYITVADCQSCASQDTRTCHQKQIRLPVPSLPKAIIPGKGHPGCIIKNKPRQSARNCLDIPIHEADKGHTGYCSNIDERWDYICPQLGHHIRDTVIPPDRYCTKISIELLPTCDSTFENWALVENHSSPLDHRTSGKAQENNFRTPLTLRRIASDHLRPVCATSNIRIRRAGTPINGQDTIQPGTFSSDTWPDYWKPIQQYTCWHDGAATAAKLSQSIFAGDERPTLANGRKNGNCSSTVQAPLHQNFPTHAGTLRWATGLCWQTAVAND